MSEFSLPAQISEKAWRTGNDVGGRDYNELEMRLVMAIAMFLKNSRGHHHQPVGLDTDANRVRPRDYMKLYVKSAAGLYEMAKALAMLNEQSRAQPTSVIRWIQTLTGKDFTAEVLGVDPSRLALVDPRVTDLGSETLLLEEPGG